MHKLVKQYQSNIKQIEMIDAKFNKFSERKRKKMHKLEWNIYRSKIKQLQDERDKKLNTIEQEIDEREKQIDKNINRLNEVTIYVDRIISFLKLDRNKNLNISDKDIRSYRNYRSGHIESVGYLFNDDLLKIKAFIVETPKPKNKYSLYLYGKCLFNSSMIKFSYSYGLEVNENDQYEIRADLFSCPTIEGIKQYLKKYKDKILKSEIEQYKKVKKEYLQALQDHTLKDFKELKVK